jgi:hypothetical protein
LVLVYFPSPARGAHLAIHDIKPNARPAPRLPTGSKLALTTLGCMVRGEGLFFRDALSMMHIPGVQ